jgi:N-acetyltransferase 10
MSCRHIAPLPTADDGMTLLNDPSAASRAELKELVDSLGDTQPAGALVRGGL